MKKKDLTKYILDDLYRYTGNRDRITLIKQLIFNPGFKYTYLMRKCRYWSDRNILNRIIYKLLYKHYMYKYNIQIPYNIKIGEGIKIIHFGGIVINSDVIIGKNLNISHGVTIGKTLRGKNKGTPIIGDNVYIGAGAKIIGGIKIGNNVAIGANAVVTNDVPDNAVVVGIPARILSLKGNHEYMNNLI